ncbi:fibronectin type III domain-containing protein-like, partial [Stylophora pistillata]|uniref:fibronectin type III domain-containing protein-like n=1 Tax=Stylophora pistillata TaxID=50429 RepID=UPI000C048318
MRHLALLLWMSSIATLINGQGVSQQQPAPPRIVDFLDRDLIKPEEVKSGKKFDASKNWGFRLPCDAQGENPLKWSWKYNGTEITFPSAKFTLGADGSLTGSYLEAENSGSYQCFVNDATANKVTFSRKVQVAVT